MADDFVRHYDGMTRGWWGVVTHNYLHWCGRWASMGLEAMVMPRVLDSRAYAACLAAVCVVQLAAFYAFVDLLLVETVSLTRRIGLALCLWAIHWAGTPEPGQTSYWLTGCIENQLSFSLAVILVCLVARSRPRSPMRNTLWLTVGSLAALFVTGMHELVGAVLVAALAIGSFVGHRWRTDNRWFWFTLLGVAAAGLTVTVAAPGNLVRAGHFEHSQQLGKTIGLTARFVFRDVPVWFADPKLGEQYVPAACASSFSVLLRPPGRGFARTPDGIPDVTQMHLRSASARLMLSFSTRKSIDSRHTSTPGRGGLLRDDDGDRFEPAAVVGPVLPVDGIGLLPVVPRRTSSR